MAHDAELRAPLLSSVRHEQQQQQKQRRAKSNGAPPAAAGSTHSLGFVGGVLNLTKAVIGAGMLSVPRALLLLGAIPFSIGLVLVSFLTVFTIQFGLVFPSVLFDRKGSALRLGTYPAAVRHWVGGAAEYLLTLTMLAGLLLAQTSYFDVFADILVGDESNPGLLATLVHAMCGCKVYSATLPSAALCSSLPANSSSSSSIEGTQWTQLLVNATSAWRPHQPTDLLTTGLWLSESSHHGMSCGHHPHPAPNGDDVPRWMALLMDRHVALGLMVVLVVLPLSLKRHMGGTAAINAVGVAALLAFLGSVVTLAVAALRSGQAHALPLMPNWGELAGGGSGASSNGLLPPALDWGVVKEVASVLGVLSVLLTANSCYSNVHPMLSVVRPFSRRKAGAIVAVTIAITTCFYWLVSACAYLAFGPTIQGDVLQNLSPAKMEPLVGPVAAHAMALTVRIAYLISIVASAVLSMFPLRQVLADMFLGAPPQPPASMTVLPGPKPQQQHAPVGAGAHTMARAQSDAMGFAATLSSDDDDDDAVLQPLDEEQGHSPLADDGEVLKQRFGGSAGGATPFASQPAGAWAIPGRQGRGSEPRSAPQWKQLCAPAEREEGDASSADDAGCPSSPLVVLPSSLGAHLLASRTTALTTTLATAHGPALAYPPRAASRQHSSSGQLAVGLEQLQQLHASAAHEAELATSRALERHAAWRGALHVPLTVAVLVLTFVLAVAVPNIWMAMSLLGSASASIVSFVMPALVGLFALEPLRLIGVGRTAGLRWVLYLTIALGLVIFANGWLTLALARAG